MNGSICPHLLEMPNLIYNKQKIELAFKSLKQAKDLWKKGPTNVSIFLRAILIGCSNSKPFHLFLEFG